jgi:hypothetical protein
MPSIEKTLTIDALESADGQRGNLAKVFTAGGWSKWIVGATVSIQNGLG